MYVILNDELAHHGIKGQRWGVRRFQNTDGSLKPAGEKRYSTGQNGGAKDTEESKSKKTSNDETSNTKPKRKTKDVLNDKIGGSESDKGFKSLSPKQKKILIGLGLVAVTATATVVMKKTGLLDKSIDDEIAANRKNNPFSAIKMKPMETSKADDMKHINPMFGLKFGASSNCALCTTAYDMRRRGYDVTANYSKAGRRKTDISLFYKNVTALDWEDAGTTKESVMKAFDKMPNGSRGNILAQVGRLATGHSMVWEKENGKVTIRDCQTNTIYDSKNMFYEKGSKGIIRLGKETISFLRTDNLEIHPDRIMDAVKPYNAKKLDKWVAVIKNAKL